MRPVRGHVLIVGGGNPTLSKARALGVHTTLFQQISNAPSQLSLVDRAVIFDFRRVDEACALAEAINKIEKIDAVVSFTELGLEPASAIGESLGCACNPLAPVTSILIAP